jgi:hypothetical protein
MMQIVLNILDEQKAKSLLSLLNDLSYVDVMTNDNLKVWEGIRSKPIKVEDFKIFSREELHER